MGQGDDGNLKFLGEDKDEAEDEEAQKEGMLDSSCKILSIILETIEERFGSNFRVFYEIWKNIVKGNDFLEEKFTSKVKELYKRKKTEHLAQFVTLKLEGKEFGELASVSKKMTDKYLLEGKMAGDHEEKNKVLELLRQELTGRLEEEQRAKTGISNEVKADLIYECISNLCSTFDQQI